MNEMSRHLRIGQVAVTSAGRAHAATLAAHYGDQCTLYEGPATVALPEAWAGCDVVVAHLAVGATTRIVAPLLAAKSADPAVVVVDESGRFVVPLVGGHAAGANRFAAEIAGLLGATPVVTTATDAAGLPGLDDLGWPVEGEVAAVTRRMLDGEPVALDTPVTWPLPALPANVSEQSARPAARIRVDDRVLPPAPEEDLATVVLRPPSLVVGMGCARGTSADDLERLLRDTLSAEALAVGSVARLVSVDLKADEEGLRDLADRLRVPFQTFPAGRLASYDVPNPSERVRDEVGTPSVAEASVLAAGADLVVPKRRSDVATVAVGRLRPVGRLAVVGLGPGARDLLTPRAVAALRQASVVVGLDQYVDQVRDLLRPGTRVLDSALGAEEERARLALAEARAGNSAALVCSGDAGIYAMASPTLEPGTAGVEVAVVPGITAGLAAAAALGAPLGHDHVTISLSDLHTPWPAIERRVHAAAEGDFVTVFYNPRSRTRTWQLPKALAILAGHRPPDTPVAVVEDCTRPGERVLRAALADLDPNVVTMRSLVVVGAASTSWVRAGADGDRRHMVTPRGYTWMGS